MSGKQQGAVSRWSPVRAWQRLGWRWKMTLAGALMGAFARGLWTAPAAYFALKAGYIGHGYLHMGSTAFVIALGAGGMLFFGIRRMERDMDEDREDRSTREMRNS